MYISGISNGKIIGCVLYWPTIWRRFLLEKTLQGGAQFGIAKLVPITPITMVYGRYDYSIHGVYKPTYNWRAPSCRELGLFHRKNSVDQRSTWGKKISGNQLDGASTNLIFFCYGKIQTGTKSFPKTKNWNKKASLKSSTCYRVNVRRGKPMRGFRNGNDLRLWCNFSHIELLEPLGYPLAKGTIPQWQWRPPVVCLLQDTPFCETPGWMYWISFWIYSA